MKMDRMSAGTDINILLDQIRDVIKARSVGNLTLEKTRDAYKKLLLQYRKLERKYVSDHVTGFIKGLLYHHNTANSAHLTAIYVMKNGNPVPLASAGDKILMNALPELISREYGSLRDSVITRIPLGEQGGQAFTLMLTTIAAVRETIVAGTVTSSPLFNADDFKFLAELLKTIYEKNSEFFTPVMLNYMHDISSQISKIFNDGKGDAVYVDRFTLYNPHESLYHAGIYKLIEFSNFIVNTLKRTYPDTVRIFALSLSSYLVLYDENTKQRLDIKRNRIDFDFHGNNIPYKVLHTEIDTPQSLYLFLEKL
ncbi:MAG: hypothetical protein A2176_15525 [Spirochaetes bacterium RBG_13_51_14]|nr:MAG: hypothetical protein A2176_15525 [Spirochaetes bacterium RBG_13_51_14]